MINCRFLLQQTSGVQRFAEELVRALSRRRDDLLLVAPKGELRVATIGDVPVTQFGVMTGHAWEQFELPAYLRNSGDPLLLNLLNTGPVLYRNQILTHHDIAYLRHPESYSWRFRTFYRIMTRATVRRAREVITVSEFSRREICSTYAVDPERVHVIYNAVSADFCPVEQDDGPRYVLAVASSAAHKNIPFLTRSFAGLRDDIRLHIVGGRHKNFAESQDGFDQEDPRIERLGRVPDEQLAAQYSGALALVFPSLYEGFGIPPLEAQACGTAVVAADIPVLREILGSSALFFDPKDEESLQRAIHSIIESDDLARMMAARGSENVSRFSWDESAERLDALCANTAVAIGENRGRMSHRGRPHGG